MAGQGAGGAGGLEDPPSSTAGHPGRRRRTDLRHGDGGARGAAERSRLIGVQAGRERRAGRRVSHAELAPAGPTPSPTASPSKIRGPTLRRSSRPGRRVVTVSDEAIARTIVLLLERHKLLAEGAGAAALAAMIEGLICRRSWPAARVWRGRQWRQHRSEPARQGAPARHGQRRPLPRAADVARGCPGQLQDLTGLLAAERINILHVGIHRLGPYTALGRVGWT